MQDPLQQSKLHAVLPRQARRLWRPGLVAAGVSWAWVTGGWQLAGAAAGIGAGLMLLDLHSGVVRNGATWVRNRVTDLFALVYQLILVVGRRERVPARWVSAGDWAPVGRRLHSAVPLRRRWSLILVSLGVLLGDQAVGALVPSWQPKVATPIDEDQRFDTTPLSTPTLKQIQEDSMNFYLVRDPGTSTAWYLSDGKTRTLTWSRKEGRRTWGPAEPRYRIAVIGGSSALGSGQADDETVASELARELDRAGYPTEVDNFGMVGYTLYQAAKDLENRIDNGAGPYDLVIAYGGFNETMIGVNGKEAPDTLFTLHEEITSISRGVDRILDRSLLLRPFRARKVSRGLPVSFRLTSLPNLTGNIGTAVDHTLASIELAAHELENLSGRHRFDALILWTPSWAQLGHERQKQHPVVNLQESTVETYRQVLPEVERRAATELGERFVPTQAGIEEHDCFLDVVHTIGSCSPLIARQVLGPVMAALEKRKEQQ